MITDEKRREVAKELRDQAEAWRNIMPDIRMSDRRLVAIDPDGGTIEILED